MSRRDFHFVRIAKKIYAALEGRLGPDTAREYKPLSMNEFIEKILWGYVTEDLVPKEQMSRRRKIRNLSEPPWYLEGHEPTHRVDRVADDAKSKAREEEMDRMWERIPPPSADIPAAPRAKQAPRKKKASDG